MDEIDPNFKKVSYYHTPEAQDLYHALIGNQRLEL